MGLCIVWSALKILEINLSFCLSRIFFLVKQTIFSYRQRGAQFGHIFLWPTGKNLCLKKNWPPPYKRYATKGIFDHDMLGGQIRPRKIWVNHANTKNIVLFWNISNEHIFLDLEITKAGDVFKTDQNSFITLESCNQQKMIMQYPQGAVHTPAVQLYFRLEFYHSVSDPV